jgi:BirA family biotin operon repressor/biotin-[acetyl-CoA-carboxylase] ligase
VADTRLSWGAEALWEALHPLLPGLSVEIAASLPSTNTVLLDRARAQGREALANDSDAPAMVRQSVESAAFGRRSVDWHPCLLVAESQTAGRGRLGRSWHGEPLASLSFSLALPLGPEDWSGLSLAVGVALAEALDPAAAGTPPTPPRIGLKWPNDLVLIDRAPELATDARGIGRKLGGILIETVSAGSKRLAVVGIGLNVRPLALRSNEASMGVACLQELHPGLEAPAALAQVALPLVQALLRFEQAGFSPFVDRFRNRDVLLGRQVTTTQAGLGLGTARGVAADGCLQLDTPQGLQRLNSGEVSVRPLDATATEPRC